MIWWIVIVSAGVGFLFGLLATGYYGEPKKPILFIEFRVRNKMVHIHHWMWVSVVLLVLIGLMVGGVLDDNALWLNILFGFGSGYAVQGLFVKNAFRVVRSSRE